MKIIKEQKLNEAKYAYPQGLLNDLDKLIDRYGDKLDDEFADIYLFQLATLFADYLSMAHLNLADDTSLTVNKNHILAVIKQTLL